MQSHKLLCYVTVIFVLLYTLWHQFNDTFHLLHLFTHSCVISALLVVSWTVGHYIYDLFNTDTISPDNKAVLITGCDSGFGHLLAQKLDDDGFHVFAGVLFPDGEGAKTLARKCSKRIKLLKMDVTQQSEVESAVNEVRKSKLPLWAVVNNAGIAIGCPFDWGHDVDQYKQTFEVNVFGLVRVTKCCIPLLRQSKGRVVNMASVAGRMNAPIMGHYCMSKNSVRAFSDVARRELYLEGIKVVTIEPTFYNTPIVDFGRIFRTKNRIYEDTPDDIKAAYSKSQVKSIENMECLVKVIIRNNVNEVVNTMQKAVKLTHPKPFYRCCGYHDIGIWAASHLPETIVDVCITAIFYNKYSIILAKWYTNTFRNNTKLHRA